MTDTIAKNQKTMPTLKTLCKTLIIAVCALTIYSCSNNDEFDPSNFRLQSIKWKLDANDTEKIDTIELPTTKDINHTDESMYVTFSIENQIEEISQFFCDDSELFNTLIPQDTTILVSITNNTKDFSSKYTELQSDIKAPFNLGKNVLPPHSKSKNTIKVPPHTQVTTTSIVSMKEGTATYSATFIKDNGEIILITGKWKRVILDGTKMSHVFEDVK